MTDSGNHSQLDDLVPMGYLGGLVVFPEYGWPMTWVKQFMFGCGPKVYGPECDSHMNVVVKVPIEVVRLYGKDALPLQRLLWDRNRLLNELVEEDYGLKSISLLMLEKKVAESQKQVNKSAEESQAYIVGEKVRPSMSMGKVLMMLLLSSLLLSLTIGIQLEPNGSSPSTLGSSGSEKWYDKQSANDLLDMLDNLPPYIDDTSDIGAPTGNTQGSLATDTTTANYSFHANNLNMCTDNDIGFSLANQKDSVPNKAANGPDDSKDCEEPCIQVMTLTMKHVSKANPGDFADAVTKAMCAGDNYGYAVSVPHNGGFSFLNTDGAKESIENLVEVCRGVIKFYSHDYVLIEKENGAALILQAVHHKK